MDSLVYEKQNNISHEYLLEVKNETTITFKGINVTTIRKTEHELNQAVVYEIKSNQIKSFSRLPYLPQRTHHHEHTGWQRTRDHLLLPFALVHRRPR